MDHIGLLGKVRYESGGPCQKVRGRYLRLGISDEPETSFHGTSGNEWCFAEPVARFL